MTARSTRSTGPFVVPAIDALHGRYGETQFFNLPAHVYIALIKTRQQDQQ